MKMLDLHNTPHIDAEPKVIRFVEDNWGSGEEAEIITGNSSAMQGVVFRILDEYGLSYQIGRMWDINNKGYIVTWFE
jgi:hypothetical protein